MRLHPLTIPYRSISRAISGGTLLGVLGLVLRSLDQLDAVLVPVLAGIGAIAGAAYGLASYFRFEYHVTEDALEVRRGVVARRSREIPIRRIQNVDVQRSLLQRVFDVGVVRVETAGGQNTEAVLALVSTAEAHRLRTRLAGTRPDVDAGAAEGSDAPTPTSPPGEQLFALRTPELLLLSLIAFYPGLAVALIVLAPLAGTQVLGVLEAIATSIGLPGPVADALRDPLYAIGVTSLSGAALLVGTWILSGATAANRFYGFTLRQDGRTLLYERGLLRRYSGSIPLSKLQRLSIGESVLARLFGYASLRLETAGYAGSGSGGEESNASETAVPLARRQRVWALIARLESVDPAAPDFERPPRRARRRYIVRYLFVVLLLAGVLFASRDFSPLTIDYRLAVLATPLAVLAGHLKWRHRGFRLADNHAIVRTGFWRRRTRVVPYYRVQTVLRTATPFQRRLGLAHLVIDTATSTRFRASPATAFDLDRGTAEALQDRIRRELVAQLEARRHAETPDPDQ